jgi:antitoxin (DNA-binding transcriptional repressor) of toxin-antitoxin stability system
VKAKVADLKDHLSRYLDHVRSGGTVLVLHRDRPIARIVPLERGRTRQHATTRLDELERQGLIRRGTGDAWEWLGRHRPVKVPGSVLRDLMEERRSGW